MKMCHVIRYKYGYKDGYKHNGQKRYKRCINHSQGARKNYQYIMELYGGGRMIIPEKLRDKILKRLHEGHLGINAMKGICRHYIWWPGMNKEIEDVTTCRY